MKAPKDNWIIQIDITNACIHQCSNCSRSCMHQKKPYMMDFETFCKAVDSTIDHSGILGIIGGEPTLHPQFIQMCDYIRDKLDKDTRPNPRELAMPTNDYLKMRLLYESRYREIYEYEDGIKSIIRGAGLWSSMSKEYLNNMEYIQDTFKFQLLNDHTAVSLHQPVLISRKDLKISDDEWLKLREKCWLNQTWSGSITPKGCFFCEIAGALDYMYDGPGGLPIEKGWWKKDISEFEDQFRWCELCGIPLKTFSRDANENITDVSISNYELMKKHNCINMDNNHVSVVNIENGKAYRAENSIEEYRGSRYISDINDRFSEKNPIYNHEFYAVLYCDSTKKNLIDDVVTKNKDKFTDIYVIDEKDKFQGINNIIKKIGKNQYLFIFTPEIVLTDKVNILKKCAINPGTLHYINFSEKKSNKNSYIENSADISHGICMLFNTGAKSLATGESVLIENFKNLSDLKEIWQPEKIVEFSDYMNANIYSRKGVNKNKIRIIKAISSFKRSGFIKTARYYTRKIKNLTEKDPSLWA